MKTVITRKLTSALSLAAITTLCCAHFTASAITIATTNGTGADVQLTGWNGPNADPTNVVDSAANTDQMNVRFTTNRNEIMALRFDLGANTPSGQTNYTLQIVNQRANGAVTLFYYGVLNGAVGEDNNGSTPGYTDNTWAEGSVVFSTMPGLHWTNTTTAEQIVTNAVLLGSALMNNTAEGSLVSFTSSAMNDFIQTNSDSLITILVVRTDTGGTQARFAAKEATLLASGGTGNAGDYAPRLKFTAIGCDPAVVTANPASQQVLPGAAATFTVTATGTTPSYQWQVLSNGTVTWFNISGGTATSYTTPATVGADNGNQYRCNVSVPCDSDIATSAAATLTLGAPANWNGSVNTDWNVGGNWDTTITPGLFTNALVGTGFTINYTNPAISAFKSLTNGSTININTNNFTNTYTWGNVAGGVFNINSGGQMGVGGDLALYLGSGLSLAPGGSLNVTRLIIGSGSTGGTGSASASSYGRVTNNGGILIASSTLLNPGNGSLSSTVGTDASAILLIKGGTNRLGAVAIQRLAGSTTTPNTLGRDGLIVSNGIVEMTSLSVGNNAHGTVLIAGGNVTNSGNTISTNVTSGRPARFLQTGGLYVGSGTLFVSPSGGAQAIGSITGGTNIIGGIQLGSGAATGTARFTNSASIYVGSNGIAYNGVVTIENSLSAGGLFGAQADWTGAAPLTLGAGAFTFRAAALDGTTHTITYTAALGGTGSLVKTGAGTLTLGGTNAYTGQTLINQGTLALGALGSVAAGGTIVVASNAVFDVSAVTGGYAQPATKTLAGWGGVNGNVTVFPTGVIDPGTNGSYGTLTFSNSITMTNGAKAAFDLSTNPSGPTNDLIVVTTDLNVSGVSNIIQLTGGGAAGSLHPLFNYYGSFNGNLTNFIVSGPSGVLTNIVSSTPKVIAFRIQAAVRAATNVVWVGNGVANNWDTLNATNWLNGAALDYFVTGDNALFNASGAANPNVNIVGSVSPASTTVNAATDYSFAGAGSIGGAGGITKTNSGRLTILNTNQFTGGVSIKAGTVSVASLDNDGVSSPLGQSGTISVDGGTLEYTGGNNTWTRSVTIGAANGAISVSNAATTLTQSGQLVGGGILTKTGNGTLALENGGNSYSSTVVSSGTLAVNALTGAGAGSISLNSGTILSIGGAFKPANSVVILGPSIITGGNTGGSNGVAAVSGSSNVVVSVKTGVFDFIGTMTNYTGTMTFSNAGGASIRFQGTTGSSLATFDLGVGTMDLMIRNSLANVNIGGLKGAAGTTLSGRGGSSNNGPTTHHIGANGADTTFDGVIQNGSGGGSSTTAIVKTGTGKLTLTNACTYTGTTTVSNGTLQVNGALGATAVTVAGGTLAGTGTIGGSVVVQTGASVAPGASPGTLTVSGSVQLDSGSSTQMEIDSGAGTNDLLSGGTTITYGGTLSVTNLSGALTNGSTFKLFNAQDEFSYSGAFDGGTNLPALGSGLAWDTTGLATNGVISVFSSFTVNTTPTNIIKSVSGGNLTLTWPSDHIGWTLQTQTNSRSVGLVPATNAWFDVSGSSTTNQVVLPIGTNGTVFFRLRYPQP